jgi:YHS domain-containing protein
VTTKISLLAIGLLAACTPTRDAPTAQSGPLAAWDPVDPMFAGCQGACGARVEGPQTEIAVQPGATVGQRTYCPVSGAVFTVEATHPHAEVDGQTLHFCCPACAEYFEAHRDEVMEARGMQRGAAAHATATPPNHGGG